VVDSEVGARQGGSQRRGRGTPGRWSAARSGCTREVDHGEVEAPGSRLLVGSRCALRAGAATLVAGGMGATGGRRLELLGSLHRRRNLDQEMGIMAMEEGG
jgi:hypothetical protein